MQPGPVIVRRSRKAIPSGSRNSKRDLEPCSTSPLAGHYHDALEIDGPGPFDWSPTAVHKHVDSDLEIHATDPVTPLSKQDRPVASSTHKNLAVDHYTWIDHQQTSDEQHHQFPTSIIRFALDPSTNEPDPEPTPTMNSSVMNKIRDAQSEVKKLESTINNMCSSIEKRDTGLCATKEALYAIMIELDLLNNKMEYLAGCSFVVRSVKI
ncbi:hypothetical protein KCU85_g9797, partial [Aureobasidium melanogenum]